MTSSNHASNLFSDSCPKCYESNKTDSGFLSGANLISEGNLSFEDLSTEQSCSSVDCHKNNQKSMQLDSGIDVGLHEHFSGLTLEDKSDHDVIYSAKSIHLISSNLESSESKDEKCNKIIVSQPWELYFQQDEEGDTQLHIAIIQGFIEVVYSLIRMVPHPCFLDILNDAVQCTKAMSSWTERMHRRAATFSNVVTSCGHPSVPYPRRLEKVKFGIPIDEVCKNDIPGSLLVLILKLNKEAPEKKDVFRAPGHQGNMKKLIHFLQAGRLVNLDNFSVYTIASVLKKFLRKLPGGIFGREGEQELFHVIEMDDVDEQREIIHRLITSLPVHTQKLLVLLFGTFRVIATNSERCQTGMTSEALGVSVAPSFFQTCVSDGKQAKMEDVQRFKVATKIMKFMIDNFGVSNLFGRENYEYYARITGRILKVEEDWIYNFRYPPDCFVSPMSQQEESQSTPALIHVPDFGGETCNTSLSIIPKTNLLESYTRLSISLEENGLFKGSSRSSSSSATSGHHMTLEELRAVNRYAESTKSLSYLPQVHERQAARMRTRSEWFLSPLIAPGQLLYAIDSDPASIFLLRSSCGRSSAGNIDYRLLKMLTKKGGTALSASAESIQKRPSIRRNNSRHIHRTSSKRNKENGSSKKHSPSTSFKKSHQDKIEGKSTKYNSHDTKPKKLPEEAELLKESNVNVNIGRLLKETASINIYGSQNLEENFSNLSQVQDIRLLKMSSLDATAVGTGSSQSKLQKMNSLGSSNSITEANANPQLCRQVKVDEVKEEDALDMEVTTYNVTLNYKPRI